MLRGKRRRIFPSLPPEPRCEPQTVMYIYIYCGSLLSVHVVYIMSSIKSLRRVQKYALDVFVISLVGSCHLLDPRDRRSKSERCGGTELEASKVHDATN